jgi:hypothetical protein
VDMVVGSGSSGWLCLIRVRVGVAIIGGYVISVCMC